MTARLSDARPMPCPFCGTRLETAADPRWRWRHPIDAPDDCAARLLPHIFTDDFRAIAAWNNRALVSELVGALESLIEIDNDDINLSGDEVRRRLKNARFVVVKAAGGGRR